MFLLLILALSIIGCVLSVLGSRTDTYLLQYGGTIIIGFSFGMAIANIIVSGGVSDVMSA